MLYFKSIIQHLRFFLLQIAVGSSCIKFSGAVYAGCFFSDTICMRRHQRISARKSNKLKWEQLLFDGSIVVFTTLPRGWNVHRVVLFMNLYIENYPQTVRWAVRWPTLPWWSDMFSVCLGNICSHDFVHTSVQTLRCDGMVRKDPGVRSLTELLFDELIGLFYQLYQTASLFPLAYKWLPFFPTQHIELCAKRQSFLFSAIVFVVHQYLLDFIFSVLTWLMRLHLGGERRTGCNAFLEQARFCAFLKWPFCFFSR